jgi:hypothetical protein
MRLPLFPLPFELSITYMINGSVPDLLTWVLDRKCEFIAIHEESKDDIMHHD